jgi:HEAT repeat protein
MMSIPTSQARPRKDEGTVSDAISALQRADFHAQDLVPLSDMGRADVRTFASAWSSVPLEARISAIRQMAEMAEDRVELGFGRALRIALDDPSPIVRQLAIDALWEDEGTDLIELHRERLRSDDSLDVRAAAAQGLGRFAEQASLGQLDETASEQLLDDLLAFAGDGRAAHLVRRRALESVAAFGARPEIVDLIREAYEDDDPSLRAGALFAMGRSLDRRWLDLLLAELSSPDAEMRFEAARACGELGDASAVEGLVLCAQDRDADVRQAAIAALGRIASGSAVRSLRSLAETARPADRVAIEAALDEAMSDAEL